MSRKAESWNQILAPYERPDTSRALSQLSASGALYALVWYLMLRSLDDSYWLTLLLVVPASGLLVRLFIIQHDCGHGSFFKSRTWNNTLGFLLGVLLLTPYDYWRRTHAIHHSTSGDLDRRGVGDVGTLTVQEYLGLARWNRLQYRLYRHPLILFVIGPAYQFILKHRMPFDIPRTWKKEWASVLWTDLGIVSVLAVAGTTIGIQRFLMVQLPIFLLSAMLGSWLFYVQHQFEDSYWRPHREWDFHRAGLQGSSFYDLPPILRWITGNIGYHHIHHLSSLIPNYRLKTVLRRESGASPGNPGDALGKPTVRSP